MPEIIEYGVRSINLSPRHRPAIALNELRDLIDDLSEHLPPELEQVTPEVIARLNGDVTAILSAIYRLSDAREQM